jgi:hypothetical protein
MAKTPIFMEIQIYHGGAETRRKTNIRKVAIERNLWRNSRLSASMQWPYNFAFLRASVSPW